MNSHRATKEIKLRVNSWDVELHERQLQRMTAIMKQFGESITSLELNGIALSISSILEWLHHLPKLESLTFVNGKTACSAIEKTTMSLQLPSLKSLKITHFDGLLDIVNLIPVGSLSYFYHYDNCYNQLTEPTDILQTILTNQHNVKSIQLSDLPEDPAVLCVSNLQLETLTLTSYSTHSNDVLLEILECHPNLRELILPGYQLSPSSFEWICSNLKKLKVLEVYPDRKPPETNAFALLEELKNLRHFFANDSQYLLANGFQFKNDSLEKIECTDSNPVCCGEPLNKMVHSMVQNFKNLRDLEMDFDDFAALSFVLNHCTTLTHLTSRIRDLIPDQLLQQHFPNIKHLQLSAYHQANKKSYKVSQSMNRIVRAMPKLKTLSIPNNKLMFNIDLMKEFVNGSKSLDYLHVSCFELDANLSTADFVQTIRSLLDQLTGYQLMFTTSTAYRELNWHALSTEFNVRNGVGNSNGLARFCIYRRENETIKFYKKNY